MSVLKRFKGDLNVTVRSYADRQKKMNSKRQVNVSELYSIIRDADGVVALISALNMYLKKLPHRSTLRKAVRKVLKQECYQLEKLLNQELLDVKRQGADDVQKMKQNLGGRVVKLENVVGVVQRDLQESIAEIARLRTENEFLVEQLDVLHAENVRIRTEVLQARKRVVQLEAEATDKDALIASLRSENQRLAQLLQLPNAYQASASHKYPGFFGATGPSMQVPAAQSSVRPAQAVVG